MSSDFSLSLFKAVSVVVAPFMLSAVGFTTGGIAAGSTAASMMSSAAVANGGGVASGSLVALLQSFGNQTNLEMRKTVDFFSS